MAAYVGPNMVYPPITSNGLLFVDPVVDGRVTTPPLREHLLSGMIRELETESAREIIAVVRLINRRVEDNDSGLVWRQFVVFFAARKRRLREHGDNAR